MLTYTTLFLCQQRPRSCLMYHLVKVVLLDAFQQNTNHFFTGGLSVCKLSLLHKEESDNLFMSLLMIR